MLGYSDDGDFTAIPSQVREVITLNGPDIYGQGAVSREVYIVGGGTKDTTGGPVINPAGEVLGVTFGVANDRPDTGFALTANEIGPQLEELTNTVSVETGRDKC